MSETSGYRRVLLKLSGNALAKADGNGFDDKQMAYIAGEIADVKRSVSALAIVVGAGNILRGAGFTGGGKARLQADQAGMVATVVNALVLQQVLDETGIDTYVCSALQIGSAVDGFKRARCRAELDKERVVILAGGTGNPLFTTDTAAVLRAVQLEMEIVLKATRVNGVYSGDPELDTSSKFIPQLSYDEVLDKRLEIMDFQAIAMCREHNMPVRVFNFRQKGNLARTVSGNPIGTFIGS